MISYRPTLHMEWGVFALFGSSYLERKATDMDRRTFIGTLALGAAAITACRSPLLMEPATRRKVQVAELDPPGGGGGGDSVSLLGLYLPAGAGVERLFLPPTGTIKDLLLSAQQLHGLTVEFEWVPGQGDFVTRIGAVTVTTMSVPNLFYAVGAAPFTTTAEWELGVGRTGRGVNTQTCPPAGGTVDFRVAYL